jgi:CubicO group peptidase (beta-lactamase class C family)
MSYEQNGTGNVMLLDRRRNDGIENRHPLSFELLGRSHGACQTQRQSQKRKSLRNQVGQRRNVSNVQHTVRAGSSYVGTGAISANPAAPPAFYDEILSSDLALSFLTKSAGSSLVPDFQAQDELFARAFSVLEDAVRDRAFPCASIAVTQAGKLIALKAFGSFTYGDSPLATPATVFDLASVTKVVATTTMAAIEYERGLLALETPLIAVTPEFSSNDSRRSEVTLRMLLAHRSGLPAYQKLFLRATTRDALVEEAFSVPLKRPPGTQGEYSDIGFILLGLGLERIATEPLDRFCQREIFGPLGMASTTFTPPASWRAKVPPTADDLSFRKRIIQGEVQDENASVMEGVAGHAGLFSTAADLATFAHAMLNGGKPILGSDALATFTQKQGEGTSRALGWDTPSRPSQSGGYFSRSAFGHLGYTGTSLWIDPERQLSITLLTNRTWPDCTNQAIQQVRPRFHDAVIESLETSH